MQAAILEEAPGELVVDEVSIDKPLADEVLIQTVACGLCHSDLHIIDGTMAFPLPAIAGHEAAGVVQAVGPNVDEFAVGDRVVGCLSTFCGTCVECHVGRTWACENRGALNFAPARQPRLTRNGEKVMQMAGLGGFAEEMLVHRNSIVKVPHELPLDRGALLGCAVMTGVGSVFNGAKVEPGSTVAVIGCGGIGLNVIQGAVLAGAERVIAVDIHDQKLELARVFGATDTVNASTTDAVGTVVEMTRGGVHYAFEAIGNPKAMSQAYEMVRMGRTAYMIGIAPEGTTLEIPASPIARVAKGVQGLNMGANSFKRDIPMLANLYLQGRLLLDELMAARIGLDGINDAYDRMRQGTEARSVIVFD